MKWLNTSPTVRIINTWRNYACSYKLDLHLHRPYKLYSECVCQIFQLNNKLS